MLPRLRLTTRRMMGLVAVCAIVTAPVAWYWHATHRGWTVSRVESLIHSEISPKATRAEVGAWFDHHEIEHVQDTNPRGVSHFLSRWKDDFTWSAGSGKTPVRSMEYGMIGPDRANVDLLFSGEIEIIFLYDAYEQVVGWWVEGWPSA